MEIIPSSSSSPYNIRSNEHGISHKNKIILFGLVVRPLCSDFNSYHIGFPCLIINSKFFIYKRHIFNLSIFWIIIMYKIEIISVWNKNIATIYVNIYKMLFFVHHLMPKQLTRRIKTENVYFIVMIMIARRRRCPLMISGDMIL